MKIDNNNILLAENEDSFSVNTQYATQYQGNKDSGNFGQGKLDSILLHYTASLNVKSDLNILTSPNKQVSVQFVVDTNGDIYQLMPANKIAWHAGVSKHKGRTGMNKYSIGIEIVNPGWLVEKADGEYYTWYNQKVNKNEAALLKHPNESSARYWHEYPNVQVDAVKELCQVITEKYKNIKYILGHDEVAPDRKQDPGPALPIQKIRDAVFDSRAMDDEDLETPDFGRVNVEFLNIREAASTTAKKVAQPLKQGQRVDILDEKNGWYQVETKIVGWVSANYIKESN